MNISFKLLQANFPSNFSAYPQKEPEPLYIQESYPKQNCSVTDESVRAEICIPDFQTKCEEDQLMGKRLETGEFCYDVTRTECTMKERTDEVEVSITL